MKEYEDISCNLLFDIARQLNRIATALEPREIKQGPVPQLLLDEINGTGAFSEHDKGDESYWTISNPYGPAIKEDSPHYSETKNNIGKAHQIIYQNDWQYCFCSIGQNHNETIKENDHG